MLLYSEPDLVNDFIAAHGGGKCAPGTFTAMGWLRDDFTLTAGLAFYDYNKASVCVNIAITDKRFPMPLLRAGLLYVFRQLKVKRLTFFIAESNLRSRNLVTRLGAVREATLREALPDGDAMIYALFPSDCAIWRKFNETWRRTGVSRPSDNYSPANAGE